VDVTYSTLIVENDSLVREGLRLLLERTEFAPRTCSLEPDAVLAQEEPAILIMFARERAELFTLIGQYREAFPGTRIVVLANESDFEVLASAMEAGANAILLTSISAEGLIKSLQAVVADNIFVMDSRIWPAGAVAVPSMDAAPVSMNGSTPSGAVLQGVGGLSLREVEIIRRIVEGDSNKHIARRLDIAEATVKAHVKTILRKIGVSNRTQAAIWAMNNGVGNEAADQDEGALPEVSAKAAAMTGAAARFIQ
jgi:two-component system, NarL family, nitrate/nitrite response regulator NarL